MNNWLFFTFLTIGIWGWQKSPMLTIDIQKPQDRSTISIEKNLAVIDIFSESGIGEATLNTRDRNWPSNITLRFHLKGLEHLAIRGKDISVTTGISSSNGQQILPHTDANDIVRQVVIKAPGNIPLESGFIEVNLSQGIFLTSEKLNIRWIDFYR